MRWLALAALVACGGPQIANEHPADISKYLPATLEASGKPKEGDPKTLHIRVYADPATRALPKWKEDIGDQIDYASQLLQPLLAVKLAVDEYKEWDGTTKLSEVDPDEDRRVMWILGYTAPVTSPTKVLADLAVAKPLDPHIVVHAWDEKTETDRLRGELPALKDAEKAEVINAHKRHMQTVVLLHGLATSLGAIAEVDSTWILNPLYSPKQHTFAERSAELMAIAIDAIDDRAATDLVAKKLIDNIEKQEYGGWIPGERDLVVAELKLAVDRAKAGKTAENIPPEAYEQWSRIRDLRKTNPEQALVELANLLAAYPANASMHQLKCDMLLAKPGVKDPATRAACTRVSELAPGEPGPHLAVGDALAKAKDNKAAREELVKAEPKIANLGAGAPEAWNKLVAIYVAMGALTWAEDAIAKGKLDGAPAAAQAAQTRARYGLPKGARFVTPDREGAYVAAVRGALDLVYASKYGDAEKALAAGDKAFPGAPGLIGVRCDLEMRKGAIDAARATCNRAIAIDPDESWALYLGGVIDLRDTSTTPSGIAKLRRAIVADPELGQAWRTLGKAYQRAKDKAAFEALDKDYTAKFGSALPR